MMRPGIILIDNRALGAGKNDEFEEMGYIPLVGHNRQ